MIIIAVTGPRRVSRPEGLEPWGRDVTCHPTSRRRDRGEGLTCGPPGRKVRHCWFYRDVQGSPGVSGDPLLVAKVCLGPGLVPTVVPRGSTLTLTPVSVRRRTGDTGATRRGGPAVRRRRRASRGSRGTISTTPVFGSPLPAPRTTHPRYRGGRGVGDRPGPGCETRPRRVSRKLHQPDKGIPL